MSEPRIDLRSDTVTLPTTGMREAMMNAELGDDVIDVDPTVAKLEKETAAILGKEAAIYMPSGTMTNQVAVRIHCQPGDEILCEEGCHIYNYEQGAFAQFSGVVARTVRGDDGILQLEQLRGLVRPDNEHMVRTRLVCLENTHNRGGGRVMPLETIDEITRWAHAQGLRTHLDGARLFNAVVATGVAADHWCKNFDTVSVCFSKGLGAPVGSALAGPRELIQAARRQRKVFGGGMRQAGVIAAGALYGLSHQVERLREDHITAQILATAIRETQGLTLEPATVDTNIVIFRVPSSLGTAPEFVERLSDRGVAMLPFSDVHVRAVTHLHITSEIAESAGRLIQEVASLKVTA